MSTPASGVQLPPPLPGVGSAADNFGVTAGNLGEYNLFDPQSFGGLTNTQVNNPYAPQYQAGSGIAGMMGTGGGLNAFQAGSGLYGIGNQLQNNVFANQPGGQAPLYNYLQNQNMQQANVENAQAGVATTPYGAGVADMSNQLFNFNWQNFLQQQQLAAAQGAGGAYGQGQQMQAQAPIQYLAGASTPYGVANTIAGTGMQALGALQGYGQQGAQIPLQQAGLYSGYAQGGQQANIAQANTALNQANLGWQESMGPFSALGNIAGMGLGGLAYGYGRGWGQGGSAA